MKIQMITPSKLKILFNLSDLEENNISLHSFLSGSESYKKFLKAIIEIAEEDLNIKIPKNNITYESYCFDYSEFIIIIFFPKYNLNNFKGDHIYYFFNFNDFLDFSNYIKSHIDFIPCGTLYKYKDILFLEITNSDLSIKKQDKLCCILAEIPNFLNTKVSPNTISRLKEFSEILSKNNALN